ncbi:tRNA glutamyl-Q(34) synthetase GluQRS [Pseudidiomarina aestuarii]|uniref:Glutamyl-Q tRNA(Asp) synthetase n=1 Tax=Pseudidiomarina aestuarii TaxID=624146 RepID=A0A7Z6ZRK7_9GAMM|nr:tRNA glutamyl-Q(34) synthetase GluQRS [Pseudidiomarina aestuarii]RUO38034.1 tRNA glutamyl-Q(34) synthetase GluQRS [Pseudidiomarina aestuarii]
MAARYQYCGRFAPTPSGPLHFGSLVAALASYLDAKAQQGRWLVRIEDIDTPRAVAGADQQILEQLDQHGLHWDGEVLYQSQRHDRYHSALEQLTQQQLTYRCICTRREIKARGPFYTGICRAHDYTQEQAPRAAIRFKNDSPQLSFHDRIAGSVTIEPDFGREDFVLFRRDGLFTYQLAVVVDDIEQEVTDIVRGADLLTASSWQLALWNTLAGRQPVFAHVPVAVDSKGRKLSKQNHAPALQSNQCLAQLQQAAEFLGLGRLEATTKERFIEQAIRAWQTKYLP